MDDPSLVIVMEQLDAEQPLVSKKPYHNAYSVERNYINSKEYHDKFEHIPVSKEIQQRLYKEAGRLLDFVDGQEEERMIAVNARTGELIVDNFSRKGDITRTGFNEDEMQNITNCDDHIILLHNHSLNGRPSAQDMLTYDMEKKVKISLILCHDGNVYGIFKVNSKIALVYSEYLENAKQKTNDLEIAKQLATIGLYRLNEISGKELFTIKKL